MALMLHTFVTLALIGAAVALTALGHDSTPAWAALGSYGAGAYVQQSADRQGQ